jgi:hypothetical protein
MGLLTKECCQSSDMMFWAIGRGLLFGLVLALRGIWKIELRSRDEEREVGIV